MLPVTYLLLNGYFDNNKALQITRQLNLNLIYYLHYGYTATLFYFKKTKLR